MKSRQRGFTLLEIMVAVAVFAVVSAALVKNASQTVHQTALIQDKTIAFWIAENQMAQFRAAPREDDTFQSTGTDRFSVNMADRDWEVVVDVSATENAAMRRVDISVFREDDLDQDIARLTGFIGLH